MVGNKYVIFIKDFGVLDSIYLGHINKVQRYRFLLNTCIIVRFVESDFNFDAQPVWKATVNPSNWLGDLFMKVQME